MKDRVFIVENAVHAARRSTIARARARDLSAWTRIEFYLPTTQNRDDLATPQSHPPAENTRMTSSAATSTNPFATSSAPPSMDSVARVEAAQKIVCKFVLLSIGAGAIPLPIFDIAASVVLQLKLIQELSDLYGVDHREDLARNAIGTCLTTTAGLMIGSRVGSSLAKFFPGAGTKFGIVRTATFFGISTHISGKILIMHFEAGGSLLDFDPIAMREHFRREYEASQQVVEQMRNEPIYA